MNAPKARARETVFVGLEGVRCYACQGLIGYFAPGSTCCVACPKCQTVNPVGQLPILCECKNVIGFAAPGAHFSVLCPKCDKTVTVST